MTGPLADAGGRAHLPVLADAVADVFTDVAPGTYVDLTLGRAGHAEMLLDAHPDLTLLGLDRDGEAVVEAARVLRRFGDRVTLHHARSDALVEVLAAHGVDDVSVVLADLGVSSPQIDQPHRGFSYRPDRDGPLDMRMDQSTGATAADLLAGMDAPGLARVLRDLGDEPHAGRIARAVIAAAPRSTAALAEAVRDAVPAARRRRGDPAKRVFQALRILVNDELAILDRTLDAALQVLAPGGRLAVISFHSLEDRMVKARLRAAADGGCSCPPGLPCVCGAAPTVRLLRRKAWVADAVEAEANPRSSSARLRACEVLDPGPHPPTRSSARPGGPHP